MIYDQIVEILTEEKDAHSAADEIIAMLEAEGLIYSDEDEEIDEEFLPPQTREELEI
jgi:hypothetical protein